VGLKMDMRLFLLLIYFLGIGCLSLSGQTSLNREIDYSISNASVAGALIKLSKETEINIAFSNSILPEGKRLDINVENQSIKYILRTILKGTNVSYKMVSNQLILFRENTQELETININGYIEDQSTGERLVGANIYNPNNAYGTDSNEYGFFSFAGVLNIDSIFISYLGYETQKILLGNVSNQSLTIKLIPIFFETIEVTASEESEEFIRRPQSGVDRLDLSVLRSITGIGGEADLFQSAYQLSGVNTGADGVGGLHVRGGNLDQNLVLLDGAPIYRPEHAIGILSVFNSDALRSAKIYKGNFPAKFGGRLSSIMDVKTKEGNNQKYEGKLTVGLLTAKASVQGPLIKNKASFFVSYRRALTDLYLPEITRIIAERDSVDGFSNYLFYDLNVKANFMAGKSDRFYLSYYEGRDDFFNRKQQPTYRDSFPAADGVLLPGSFMDGNTEELFWGNKMASFRWNHLFGGKIFANTTAYLSRFSFYSSDIFQSEGIYDIGRRDLIYVEREFTSEVVDIGLRTDFEFLHSDRMNFKFGAGIIKHTLSPGSSQNGVELQDLPDIEIDFLNLSVRDSLQLIDINAIEGLAYYETGISINRQLYLTLGLHGRYWKYDDYNHLSILPRIGIDYQLSDDISISASYLEMVQYMHLLTKSDIGLPGDIWVPSSSNLVPETATHFQIGAKLELRKDLEININAYYKEFNNLVEFLEGDSTNLLNALNYESKVTQGVGTSKGIELTAAKSGDHFAGKLNYTLSKTDRQFDDINEGLTYPYRFDLRHTFSLTGVYTFNTKWSVNANFIYSSGINLTIPTSKYGVPSPFPGVPPTPTLIFSRKNGQKLPPNHRLDIGMNYKFEKWGLRNSLHIGIYNVYNSINPIYYRLRRNPQDRSKIQFVSVSLLPITPSISYSVRF